MQNKFETKIAESKINLLLLAALVGC